MNYINYYDSPIGLLLLTFSDEGVTGVHFENDKHPIKNISLYKENTSPFFDETKRWLDIYFLGKEPNFTPILHFTGTAFRQKVCRTMCEIPYGKTCSYKDIAKIIYKSKTATGRLPQAVGQAVGHNPISIIIPCHRVLGSNGSLTGYGGGLKRKKYLLELEQTR